MTLSFQNRYAKLELGCCRLGSLLPTGPCSAKYGVFTDLQQSKSKIQRYIHFAFYFFLLFTSTYFFTYYVILVCDILNPHPNVYSVSFWPIGRKIIYENICYSFFACYLFHIRGGIKFFKAATHTTYVFYCLHKMRLVRGMQIADMWKGKKL